MGDKYISLLLEHLYQSREELGIDFWLTSGAICQTVWNYLDGKPTNYGISDYDIVYFDSDTSYEKEDFVIGYLKQDFLPLKMDIKNQARVHIWYSEKYGVDKKPYTSVYDAMSSWISTANSIGIQLNPDFQIFAPYGLDDLFGHIIKINPNNTFDNEMFTKKANKWKEKWEKLNIINN